MSSSLRGALDGDEVARAGALALGLGGLIFRRVVVGHGLVERIELDHHVAGAGLAFERHVLAAAHERPAAVLAYRLARVLGVLGPLLGVGDVDGRDHISLRHRRPAPRNRSAWLPCARPKAQGHRPALPLPARHAKTLATRYGPELMLVALRVLLKERGGREARSAPAARPGGK